MDRKLLTDKQALFVKEYLIDLNATQAAIRAGYSERTARKIGQENLTKPDIQQAISAQQEQRAERLDVTTDQIEAELAKIAFADNPDYFSTGMTVRTTDKLKALELLGRRHGMFTDKIEHDVPIVMTDTDEEILERYIQNRMNTGA